MDIRDYREDAMYKSQVTQWGKTINIMLIYKTNLNKFFIYKQELTQTNRYTLAELQNIDIVKQKTGFGYKNFFKCPHCEHKRQNLYFVEDTLQFVCRECIDVNIYSSRTNLYDGDVKNVILYKSIKIMRSLKTEVSHISMYTLIENIPYRPRCMRQEKYALTVKRLYFLHWMWEQCYTAKYGPAVGITPKLDKLNVQEINEMLQEDNTNFVYEHFLFPRYYREAYEVLKALKDKGLIDE